MMEDIQPILSGNGSPFMNILDRRTFNQLLPRIAGNGQKIQYLVSGLSKLLLYLEKRC